MAAIRGSTFIAIGIFACVALSAHAATQTTTTSVALPPSSSSSIEKEVAIGYSGSSDLAIQKEPRLYTHRLNVDLSFAFLEDDGETERFSLGLSAGGQMKTLDTQIDARRDVVEMADLEGTISKSFRLGNWGNAIHSLGLNGGVSLPTSQDSGYEGVVAVPFASARVSSGFGKGSWVSIAQSLSLQHIVNEFRYSPVSKEINPDTSASYGLTMTVKFLKRYRLAVGGSAKSTHHLDGSNTFGFNNSQTLSASFGQFSISLKHVNGSHADSRDFDLWYVDQYRRMITLGLSYRL